MAQDDVETYFEDGQWKNRRAGRQQVNDGDDGPEPYVERHR